MQPYSTHTDMSTKSTNKIGNSNFLNRLISSSTTIIILGIMLFSSNTNAQSYKAMMKDNSVNFYDVVSAAESYFEGKDKGKVLAGKVFSDGLQIMNINTTQVEIEVMLIHILLKSNMSFIKRITQV